MFSNASMVARPLVVFGRHANYSGLRFILNKNPQLLICNALDRNRN